MSYLFSTVATRFSRCSVSDLRETLGKGYGKCLFDELKKVQDALLFLPHVGAFPLLYATSVHTNMFMIKHSR